MQHDNVETYILLVAMLTIGCTRDGTIFSETSATADMKITVQSNWRSPGAQTPSAAPSAGQHSMTPQGWHPTPMNEAGAREFGDPSASGGGVAGCQPPNGGSEVLIAGQNGIKASMPLEVCFKAEFRLPAVRCAIQVYCWPSSRRHGGYGLNPGGQVELEPAGGNVAPTACPVATR